MTESRPDPDELLQRVQAEEARQKRGKLKIFFGAAPGVGKTFAMLEAARKEAKEGVDVVIGYVEPHTRPDTMALCLGLEILPRRGVEHGGVSVLEFDLAVALARHPQLLVVDELAHTNTPSRKIVTHTKRWRDVVELLDAGIDVYTTVNVQHLESLNDIVGRITGIRVRETIPDSIFDSADEVELVDLPPDNLIERLHEGKVYVPAQAKIATEHFFKKGNLIALRELALRRTAERVGAQMLTYREEQAITGTWPTADRLLVCVSPSSTSDRLVRAAARMARSLRAPWVAVHVETKAEARLTDADRDRLAAHLNLAEQLGGETAVLSGEDPVDEIIRYARRRNVSRIIVGKPNVPRWREALRGSLVSELTRRSEEIDVYVIRGDSDTLSAPHRRALSPPVGSTLPYVWAVAVVAACTGIGAVMSGNFDETNVVMVYLLGVVAVAMRFGPGPSSLAAVLAVAAFDIVFVLPYWTFAISDAEYLVTFAVMLFTGLVISTLTGRIKFQVESSRQRERRAAALYSMSKELAAIRTREEIAAAAVKHVTDSLESDAVILLPNESKKLMTLRNPKDETQWNDSELGIAQWVFEHGQRAGLGSDTLAGSDAMYFPLLSSREVLGVLRVRPREAASSVRPEQVHRVEAFVSLTALALERVSLSASGEQARVAIESERLRNSLLSAVSHDLRTPLAAIIGSASTLTQAADHLDDSTRRELTESILDEAEALNRQVTNLLDLSRLEAGATPPKLEWQSLEELVGDSLRRLSRVLQYHPVKTHLAPNLPLIQVDGMLIAQVLVNLLENAANYTPPETPITVSAESDGLWVTVEVADRGPGLPAGSEEKVFERFYRMGTAGRRHGAGLGLAICRGIIDLHGGRIWAKNRHDGGVVFSFSLPLHGEPPSVQAEEILADESHDPFPT